MFQSKSTVQRKRRSLIRDRKCHGRATHADICFNGTASCKTSLAYQRPKRHGLSAALIETTRYGWFQISLPFTSPVAAWPVQQPGCRPWPRAAGSWVPLCLQGAGSIRPSLMPRANQKDIVSDMQMEAFGQLQKKKAVSSPGNKRTAVSICGFDVGSIISTKLLVDVGKTEPLELAIFST